MNTSKTNLRTRRARGVGVLAPGAPPPLSCSSGCARERRKLLRRDTRPKSERAREALVYVRKMKWPPAPAADSTAAYVRAGVILDVVGELYRGELAGRTPSPASASTHDLTKRWIKRDERDQEGKLTDVLRELGASRREANNWVRERATSRRRVFDPSASAARHQR